MVGFKAPRVWVIRARLVLKEFRDFKASSAAGYKGRKGTTVQLVLRGHKGRRESG